MGVRVNAIGPGLIETLLNERGTTPFRTGRGTEPDSGCHEIAVRSKELIDWEIAFPGTVSLGDGGHDKKAPRVDLAVLEKCGDKAARLALWEAKHYSNGELRAGKGVPPVLRQLRMYKKYLANNRDAIERSYTRVAQNLVSISKMGWKRQLSALITDVASGKRSFTLGTEPEVRLVIFGFDSALQHLVEPVWTIRDWTFHGDADADRSLGI